VETQDVNCRVMFLPATSARLCFCRLAARGGCPKQGRPGRNTLERAGRVDPRMPARERWDICFAVENARVSARKSAPKRKLLCLRTSGEVRASRFVELPNFVMRVRCASSSRCGWSVRSREMDHRHFPVAALASLQSPEPGGFLSGLLRSAPDGCG
jgi:hypothetical protein